ncbi:MAG: hypothetical protein O9284_02820 [Steroidobacteraceae bacterium]|jgi:hypothetical protein|nr:hypothetical protein [Steroidobacteraceae bacterium]
MKKPAAPDPLVDLARRRARLLARSARLRDALAADGAALGATARSFERGVGFARTRLARPLLVAGAVAVVAAGPRRILGLAGRAVVLWPVLRPWLQPLAGRALQLFVPWAVARLARRR